MKYIICISIIFIFSYAIFSFCLVDLDFRNWNQPTRVFYSILTILLSGAVSLIILETKKDDTLQ